jgi:hypothetical protein
MSYPYSSFYLEAQWSKLKVAEYFDSGLDALSAIGWQKVCARRCEDQRRALLDRKLFIAGGSLIWLLMFPGKKVRFCLDDAAQFAEPSPRQFGAQLAKFVRRILMTVTPNGMEQSLQANNRPAASH